MTGKDPKSSNKGLPRDAAGAHAFANLDVATASQLVAVVSDISVVLDSKGVVRDVSFASDELASDEYRAWIGKPWIDTVTRESRSKIEDMLREARSDAPSRWRQVNHPSSRGPDVPVRYATMRTERDGGVVAVGRELRGMAVLQQRLAEAQQAMEREYARIRAAETRYRLLFQLASEAVLIVDAGSLRIVDANPAAAAVIGRPIKRIGGQGFIGVFDVRSAEQVQALLSSVRVTGRPEEIRVRLAGSASEFMLSVSLFREDGMMHFLARIAQVAGTGIVPRARANILQVVEQLPDGFVIVDGDRRIVSANAAFLDLAQLSTEEQARGESVDRWIGRPGGDIDILFSNLRERGAVRNFSTILRGEYGSTEDVEIAAISVADVEEPCIGLAIRSGAWRVSAGSLSGRELPRSVEQFTELVGRVSLKNLVRETTDMIERLCIEAALELTRDNRASAAEMLGLSRQSLYSKLRRYGLGDLDHEDTPPEK